MSRLEQQKARNTKQASHQTHNSYFDQGMLNSGIDLLSLNSNIRPNTQVHHNFDQNKERESNEIFRIERPVMQSTATARSAINEVACYQQQEQRQQDFQRGANFALTRKTQDDLFVYKQTLGNSRNDHIINSQIDALLAMLSTKLEQSGS